MSDKKCLVEKFSTLHKPQTLCLCVYRTFVVVDVDSYTVWDGTVQCPGLVVVLGCEALLQPVVQVDAPGSAAFPQLVEFPEAPQGHAHSEGFALLVKPHLPVLLASVDHGVSCDDTDNTFNELQCQCFMVEVHVNIC